MAAQVEELLNELEFLVDRSATSDPRTKEITTQVRELLQHIPDHEYLEGYLASLLNDESAELLLGNAVKKDPENTVAWKLLSDEFCKKGDFSMAHECLLSSLEYKKDNLVVLRNLSMVLRKLGKTPREKMVYTMEGLKVSKDALALDFGDPLSWYLVGNAYLSVFFTISHNKKDLEAALKAYGKSEVFQNEKVQAGIKIVKNSDLYFNRAEVLAYLQRYEQAVEDYETAKVLDPGLKVDEAIYSLVRKVQVSFEFVQKKGNLKPKQIASLSAACGIQGSSIEDLKSGDLDGKESILNVRVVAHISVDTIVSLLVIDRDGNCAVLSIYSLDPGASSKIRIEKDKITLINPKLLRIQFKDCCYDVLQLETPAQLFLNDEELKSSFAHASMESTSG